MTSLLAGAGHKMLELPAVRRAALAAAAARGHGLVLVYHRLSADDEGAPASTLIPTVPEGLFSRHLEALLEVGDIVPLEALLARTEGRRRARFAITLDDDYATHVERALPALQRVGVTATFFLSGRSLHGLGPVWFEKLDALILAEGITSAAARLGLDITDVEQLAIECEEDAALQERIERVPVAGLRHVAERDIRALAEAGMTIGFHTLRHPLLSRVADASFDAALLEGVGELEAAAGVPVRLFAYPHGKADARARRRLQQSGFVAAFTGRPCPIRPRDDAFLLGRWEAGPIAVDRFIGRAIARLNGWSRNR